MLPVLYPQIESEGLRAQPSNTIRGRAGGKKEVAEGSLGEQSEAFIPYQTIGRSSSLIVTAGKWVI